MTDKSDEVLISVPEFATWVTNHEHEIRDAQAFAVDDLPQEPAPLADHLSMAQALYPRIGALLADAEGFVLKAHAAAVVAVRKQYPEMSAEERRVMTKADQGYVDAKRLRDILDVIVGALKNKSFCAMNLGRTILNPQGQRGGQ